MKFLTEAEFLTTFAEPMRRLSSEATAPVEFWSYFERIPQADFDGHNCSGGSVTFVWENSTGRFQHVLIDSEDKNVFMVIVLDIHIRDVFGHRLLDLNREYGLQRS